MSTTPKFIQLTDCDDMPPTRFNVDHIVWYMPPVKGRGSVVCVTQYGDSNEVRVDETPEQIDALLGVTEAPPSVIDVLREVMEWIACWSPNFSDDAEWQETKSRVDAVLAAARGEAQ
ncbi:hypothetical protein [Azospirillum sp.]|uniref:hypothetical protein n=1 Tax=Azospirillum sp. TaxID=34012 RepID=UPI003D72EC6B